MKHTQFLIKSLFFASFAVLFAACNDKLNELEENKTFNQGIDYTLSQNMIQPLIGSYGEFNNRGWEDFPLISVRGDDVNAGGLGDQQDYAATDKFSYNKDFWMYNSVWQNFYKDIYFINSNMKQIDLYKANGANATLAEQYKAESKVLRSFLLFQLARVWGNIFIPQSDDATELLQMSPSSKEEVMKSIVADLDQAIPLLPAVAPKERVDLPGGVTKYTALAIKALANLELKNYQGVADATSQIISSGKFSLEPNFFNLWNINGKLNKENILELQYSDFGKGTGDNISYLFAFFGPQGWTPKVSGAGDGWGFYEPSLKYIKFMLKRGETTRLQASVLFTNRGIAEIKKDADFATLPAWVSNTTIYGDKINDYARAMFASGKHYFPTEQLTPGRTDYGTNKNFTCIRYAEILLMHAEALTNGATSSAMTADAAINALRTRAGLITLSGVTKDQVIDEKFAELAMEWGTRYYDMLRLGKTNELSYDGRTFSMEKAYLPYPQNQVDLIPSLKK